MGPTPSSSLSSKKKNNSDVPTSYTAVTKKNTSDAPTSNITLIGHTMPTPSFSPYQIKNRTDATTSINSKKKKNVSDAPTSTITLIGHTLPTPSSSPSSKRKNSSDVSRSNIATTKIKNGPDVATSTNSPPSSKKKFNSDVSSVNPTTDTTLEQFLDWPTLPAHGIAPEKQTPKTKNSPDALTSPKGHKKATRP